jgi:hypothetical protein
MLTSFTPKSTDEIITSCYSSGNTREEKWLRNGTPANGWSRKTFYENGNIELHECYSNSMVIEQLFYNETGEITAHTIYSHAQKKLIEKPKQLEVHRPNVVEGCDHMGFYFKNLPAISQFIGAEYNEDELEKAYHEFINSPYEGGEEERTQHWGLEGKEMRFSLWFERSEGYYFWHLRAKDEEGYQKAKDFMERLR